MLNTLPPRVCTPTRPLGRTGFVASALGLGDVADRRIPKSDLVRLIQRGIDAGLNIVDSAPSYEDGYSEEVVGEAVRDRRKGLFVVDKVDHLDRPVAGQVESSLARMGLSDVDAFVFHAMSSLDACDQAFSPGGRFSELEAARAKGQCRFVGISSHNPEVLSKAVKTGRCDLVLFPIGPFADDRYHADVLPLCRRLGVATICFKTFGAGKLLGDTEGYNQPLRDRPRGKLSSGGDGAVEAVLPRLSVEECLAYTLTIGPDVALLGMSFTSEQDAVFDAYARSKPMSEDAMAALRERARVAIAGKGRVWWNPETPQA